MEFHKFNFHPHIAAGIKAAGFVTPTPIQEQAISPVLQGKDVMGIAQTGTGKTAVFVLPILERLINRPRGRIRALVIAPTRELAEQINTTFSDPAANAPAQHHYSRRRSHKPADTEPAPVSRSSSPAPLPVDHH
jgi:superfamily II DNA/RNA helicase